MTAVTVTYTGKFRRRRPLKPSHVAVRITQVTDVLLDDAPSIRLGKTPVGQDNSANGILGKYIAPPAGVAPAVVEKSNPNPTLRPVDRKNQHTTNGAEKRVRFGYNEVKKPPRHRDSLKRLVDLWVKQGTNQGEYFEAAEMYASAAAASGIKQDVDDVMDFVDYHLVWEHEDDDYEHGYYSALSGSPSSFDSHFSDRTVSSVRPTKTVSRHIAALDLINAPRHSVASSRTSATDYDIGIYYARHALLQDPVHKRLN
ncbi:hypothetical protein GALMADRAFT_145434 [Galerina marginata CBS 339.88]|uniref:Uncharacterized protein n=1 Tax=Galerina marginata (strain CBS 339.88) TaxID=685588 RepID=A0A067SEN1_GALM3|nr:hypothetical protein GALMADRAFT_145434 [Galerina marginata CBS 339.88]